MSAVVVAAAVPLSGRHLGRRGMNPPPYPLTTKNFREGKWKKMRRGYSRTPMPNGI